MSDTTFQWSKMSPDRSEQIVVRDDDPIAWVENIAIARKVLPVEPFPNDPPGGPAAPTVTTQAAAPLCPKHHKVMTKGKYGWYCQSKDDSEVKGWCRQKPPAEFAR